MRQRGFSARPRPEERAISAFTRVFRRAMASVSKGEGERPDACAPHRAGGHDHRGDDEQRVAEEIVDGEPERRDHQDERGELEPRRALRWRGSAIGGICLGHGSARFFAIART